MAITHQPYQIAFTAETTVYENEVQCNVSENDFNYTQNPTAATIQRDAAEASAILYITQLMTGYNYIEVYVDDPTYGTIYLGNYTQTKTDTSVNILATNIAAALNQNSYQYQVISQDNQVIITPKVGTGLSMNGKSIILVTAVYQIFDNTFDSTFN